MPENTQNNNTNNNSQAEQQKKSPCPKPDVTETRKEMYEEKN